MWDVRCFTFYIQRSAFHIGGISPPHRVDVHLVANAGENARHHAGGVFDQIAPTSLGRILMHPNHHGFKFVADMRDVFNRNQHVAARHINLIFKRHRDSHRSEGLIKRTVRAIDRFNFGFLTRRQAGDFVADAHHAGSHRSTEPAEVQIRTQDILHRQAHIDQVAVGRNIDVFQMVQESRPVVPVQVFAVINHVIAFEGGHRNKMNVGEVQPRNEPVVLVDDFVVAFLRPAHEVHFVDCHNDVLDAEQRADEAVPLGLFDDPVTRVNQDHRKVTVRCTGRHITGVLLVTGAICDDELALIG